MALSALRELLKGGGKWSPLVERALSNLKPIGDLDQNGGRDSIAGQLATVEEIQKNKAVLKLALSKAIGEPVSHIRIIANRASGRMGEEPLTWLADTSEEIRRLQLEKMKNDLNRVLFSEVISTSLNGYLRRRLLGHERFEELVSAYCADIGESLFANLRGTFWSFEDEIFWGMREIHLAYLGAAWIDDRELFEELSPLVTDYLIRSPPLMKDPVISLNPSEDETWIVFAK